MFDLLTLPSMKPWLASTVSLSRSTQVRCRPDMLLGRAAAACRRAEGGTSSSTCWGAYRARELGSAAQTPITSLLFVLDSRWLKLTPRKSYMLVSKFGP